MPYAPANSLDISRSANMNPQSPSLHAVKASLKLNATPRSLLRLVLDRDPAAGVASDGLAREEQDAAKNAHQGRQATEHGEGAVISHGVDHVPYAIADAEGEEAAVGADDDEQGAGPLGIGVEEVGDGHDVGADEGEEVGGDGPDVGEPVVVLGVRRALAVEDDGEDADDDGDEQGQEAGLGLVDAAASAGEPLDDPVTSVAIGRKSCEDSQLVYCS